MSFTLFQLFVYIRYKKYELADAVQSILGYSSSELLA